MCYMCHTCHMQDLHSITGELMKTLSSYSNVDEKTPLLLPAASIPPILALAEICLQCADRASASAFEAASELLVRGILSAPRV